MVTRLQSGGGEKFLDENILGYWEQIGYSDTADPFTGKRYSDRFLG